MSNDLRIEPARNFDLFRVSEILAANHRSPAFLEFISAEQAEYMITTRCSVEALRNQQGWGRRFALLKNGEAILGFASFELGREPEELTLNQIYIDPEFHHQGHGSRLMDHVVEKAASLGRSVVVLGVNKKNTRAIAMYNRQGFVVRESVVADIGQGFVMDDFVMARSFVPAS